jgi:hypothetical protein
MRGWVCNLLVQLLLDPSGAVTLRSKSHRTYGHILLSRLRLRQLEGQVAVVISPRNRVAQLYPRLLGFLFVASYDSQGSCGGILTRFHTSRFILKSQSHITTNNQSASLSWCQASIWDPRPIFLSPWDFLLDSCCLLFCSALSDERTDL